MTIFTYGVKNKDTRRVVSSGAGMELNYSDLLFWPLVWLWVGAYNATVDIDVFDGIEQGYGYDKRIYA